MTPPRSGAGAVRAAGEGRGENPYTLHAELQQSMNDLVGIIRKDDEIAEALEQARASSRQRVPAASPWRAHRQFNPGWHLAIDLRNMLLVSECVAKAALQRTESRGGHTRDDYPGDGRRLAQHAAGVPATGDGDAMVPGRRRRRRATDRRCGRTCSSCSSSPSWRSTSPTQRTGPSIQADGGATMATRRSFRVWRGDASGGELQDFTVEVNEGEVVLDIIHRLQATQTPDLAVRWNCKAGKCGSCSRRDQRQAAADVHDADVDLRRGRDRSRSRRCAPFPVIRDLVTDVSFNYEKAREIPSFTPPKDLQPGEYRMAAGRRRALAGVPQVHRVLPVPERLPRGARPRGEQEGVRRPALPDADRRAGHASAGHPRTAATTRRTSTASGYCNITKCCTEVCPEHIKITDNALIPMKERVVDRKYDPVVWLGNKLFRR